MLSTLDNKTQKRVNSALFVEIEHYQKRVSGIFLIVTKTPKVHTKIFLLGNETTRKKRGFSLIFIVLGIKMLKIMGITLYGNTKHHYQKKCF